ncbi:hypothetical protein HPP92_020783 [Vanilla planifolia]|uniref:Uncharacterized protein n=1 Tax=Vanilla planifolia TaxID=51239 RepID=A0A835PXX5_VANPL|nr:hypothetical protein HPP92_020783 [Vanilla planifolia]
MEGLRPGELVEGRGGRIPPSVRLVQSLGRCLLLVRHVEEPPLLLSHGAGGLGVDAMVHHLEEAPLRGGPADFRPQAVLSSSNPMQPPQVYQRRVALLDYFVFAGSPPEEKRGCISAGKEGHKETA